MADNRDDYIDLETSARDGRDLTAENRFRVRIDGDFYNIDDAKVTGRQLIGLTGKRPVDERLIFLKLAGGKFEEIRLDELVDLRRAGTERFMTFDSSASFRFSVDGERVEWGTNLITGYKLKEIAGVSPEKYSLWRELRGQEDVEVGNDDVVDLSEDGLERFFSVIAETTAGDGAAVLPSRDVAYLESQGLTYDCVQQNGQTGIIFPDFQVPEGRFDSGAVDLLILLPCGYPDAAPDMFYCLPWLRLARGGYPERADQPVEYVGKRWQRWSRHNQQWRPGKDGIWTMLKRVERAFDEAA